jgi:hypothetical protein
MRATCPGSDAADADHPALRRRPPRAATRRPPSTARPRPSPHPGAHRRDPYRCRCARPRARDPTAPTGLPPVVDWPRVSPRPGERVLPATRRSRRVRGLERPRSGRFSHRRHILLRDPLLSRIASDARTTTSRRLAACDPKQAISWRRSCNGAALLPIAEGRVTVAQGNLGFAVISYGSSHDGQARPQQPSHVDVERVPR